MSVTEKLPKNKPTVTLLGGWQPSSKGETIALPSDTPASESPEALDMRCVLCSRGLLTAALPYARVSAFVFAFRRFAARRNAAVCSIVIIRGVGALLCVRAGWNVMPLLIARSFANDCRSIVSLSLMLHPFCWASKPMRPWPLTSLVLLIENMNKWNKTIAC